MGLVSSCLPAEALGSLMISRCPADLSELLLWSKPQSPGTSSLGALSGWWIHQAPSKSHWQSVRELWSSSTQTAPVKQKSGPRFLQVPITQKSQKISSWDMRKQRGQRRRESFKWTYIWASVTYGHWMPRIGTLAGFSCVMIKLQY